MKKTLLVAGAAALMLLGSCGQKQKDVDAEGQTGEQMADGPSESTSPLQRTDTLTVGGHTYLIGMDRRTDKALPTVLDENDTEFYDNRVDVSIVCDGERVYSHSFTKADFDSYLSEADRRESVFQGMAVEADKSTAAEISFGAQVGQPGLDGEGPAFSITVSTATWEISSIQKVVNQDTTHEDMMGTDEEALSD